jgi:hypothetical protein
MMCQNYHMGVVQCGWWKVGNMTFVTSIVHGFKHIMMVGYVKCLKSKQLNGI